MNAATYKKIAIKLLALWKLTSLMQLTGAFQIGSLVTV
tara:strand:+ start:220 stop:333 length:114 start_codon:yes stop_codon:yes gene_type:complete